MVARPVAVIAQALAVTVTSQAVSPAPALPSEQTAPVAKYVGPPLYDCQAEYDILEWAWTPDWKEWCCKYEGRGCPTTTSTTLTSSTSTVTTTETTTSTTETTTSSTETSTSTATTTQTSTTQTSTSSTETTSATGTETSTTMTETSTSTKTETETSTTSTVTETTSTVTTSTVTATTTSVDLGCDMQCEIKGENATCRSRIAWTETFQTKDENAPCPAAHVIVMSTCPACGSCLFTDIKCIHTAGVNHNADAAMFMYKYAKEPELRSDHSSRGLLIAKSGSTGVTIAIGAVFAALVAFLAIGRIRRQDGPRNSRGVLTPDSENMLEVEE